MQLEVKRTALAESLRRVNNLEKANTTHMAHYADISKKNEAMEKVSLGGAVCLVGFMEQSPPGRRYHR